MPLYEHVFLARQDVSAQQVEGLTEQMQKIITDNGGKIGKTEYWGLRPLSFRIRKNRKVHYMYLRTDAPSAAVQEMERLARLHDDVMRVLSVKVEAHEDGPTVQMQKRDERGERGDRGDRGPRR